MKKLMRKFKTWLGSRCLGWRRHVFKPHSCNYPPCPWVTVCARCGEVERREAVEVSAAGVPVEGADSAPSQP